MTHVRAQIEKSGTPSGYNIGGNVGEAAGQTIGHAHLHVIPRRRGDVTDPRGGIRWVIPGRAAYWEGR
jgi:diadenosine tetraphosphate (Ap4A) HIT family hydrolase